LPIDVNNLQFTWCNHQCIQVVFDRKH